MHPEEITLKWLGSGGFDIRFGGRQLLVDPFFSRPHDAAPRLPITRQDFKNYDLLISTHARFNNFADVPYLAATVDKPVYIPRSGRKQLRKVWRNLHRSARTGNPDRWRSIEDVGKITLGELDATPLRATQRGFDFMAAWELLKRLAGYGSREEAIKRGLAYASMNPYGPSFAMHLDWRECGSRMLFMGTLSRHVFNVGEDTGRVDVMALPYFPNNRKWNDDTSRLVQRFQPRALLVHQFDQWLPPVTQTTDMKVYKERIKARFPGLPVYVPEPLKEFTLEDALCGK